MRAAGLDRVGVKFVGSYADQVLAVVSGHLAGGCEWRTLDQRNFAVGGGVENIDTLVGLNIDVCCGSCSLCIWSGFIGWDLGKGWHCREQS